jgi:hypothetical protein
VGSQLTNDTSEYSRSSVGSYANDSVDFGRLNKKQHKTRRRSSLGSCANDSSVQGRFVRPRRSSLGSYANDSVQGRFARRRRSSLGSYANDPIAYRRSQKQPVNRRYSLADTCYTTTTSNEDSVGRPQRTLSNNPDYGADTLRHCISNNVMKRRMSNSSVSSSAFSQEVYETQSINSRVGRAA